MTSIGEGTEGRKKLALECASGVIIGFFKQAKINNYYIDEKLEKDPSLNFRFREKTIKETLDILSRVYSIDFEITEKKDFYFFS